MKKSNKSAFFTSGLLQWHEKTNPRSMPWKGEKDPYKVWLSEIILQQTRVEQGVSYYLRFIKKFPTINDLATADDNIIFKLWEGLGYYSRCRNLIHTARHINTTYSGDFPGSYEQILQLKGVGPYTASAIASFAFDLPHAVVDGNVNRVIARYFGMYIPIDSTAGKKEFSTLASTLLDKKSPALYNQAIMDFGATVCKPRLPLCERCFLSLHCKAFNENTVELLPVKEKKISRKKRWFHYLVMEKDGLFAISKRSGKDIWHSLHEFPMLEETSEKDPATVLKSENAKAVLPKTYRVVASSPFYKQILTHQEIYACFTHIQINDEDLPFQYDMLSKQAISDLAFPRLINDYLTGSGWGKK